MPVSIKMGYNSSDTPGLAPLMKVLFWGRCDFPIRFSGRGMSRNIWNRLLGSSMVSAEMLQTIWGPPLPNVRPVFLLRTPGPVPLWNLPVFNVEANFSWTCLVSGQNEKTYDTLIQFYFIVWYTLSIFNVHLGNVYQMYKTSLSEIISYFQILQIHSWESH